MRCVTFYYVIRWNLVLAGEAVQEKHLVLAEPWLESGYLT
jgi:hypothetical protein